MPRALQAAVMASRKPPGRAWLLNTSARRGGANRTDLPREALQVDRVVDDRDTFGSQPCLAEQPRAGS